MKNVRYILFVFVFILGSCASVNKSHCSFYFQKESRILKICSGDSAYFLTKIRTKAKKDTLKLYVYRKFVYFTARKSKQTFDREIPIDTCFHFIQYQNKVIALSNIPVDDRPMQATPGGRARYKEIHKK